MEHPYMLASILESYHATNMANMRSRESMDKTAANVYHLNRGLLRNRIIQLSQLLRGREIYRNPLGVRNEQNQ